MCHLQIFDCWYFVVSCLLIKKLIALKVHEPHATQLISGFKRIELRHCNLEKHLNVPVALAVCPAKLHFGNIVLGFVIFGKTFKYTSREHFKSHYYLHRQDVSYFDAKGVSLFGWHVTAAHKFRSTLYVPTRQGAQIWQNCHISIDEVSAHAVSVAPRHALLFRWWSFLIPEVRKHSFVRYTNMLFRDKSWTVTLLSPGSPHLSLYLSYLSLSLSSLSPTIWQSVCLSSQFCKWRWYTLQVFSLLVIEWSPIFII